MEINQLLSSIKKINKVNIPEENKEKMKLKFLKLEKFCA